MAAASAAHHLQAPPFLRLALLSGAANVDRIGGRWTVAATNSWRSRALEVSKLSPFRCERYGGLNHRRGIGRAAIATGAGEWAWEGENRKDAWDLEHTSAGERVAVVGMLALTGMLLLRLARASALVSAGALLLFLCLGGFHHRIQPLLVSASKRLRSLSFGLLSSRTRTRTLVYKACSNGGSFRAGDGNFKPQVATVVMKDVSQRIADLTSMIASLDDEVVSGEMQSVDDLMKLQVGITELQEDLSRAASALDAKGSILQSKLQDSADFGENSENPMAIQVPIQAAMGALEGNDRGLGRDGLCSSELSEVIAQAGRDKVLNLDAPRSEETQQRVELLSNISSAFPAIPPVANYKVITTDYKLETVGDFTQLAVKSEENASSQVSELTPSEDVNSAGKLSDARTPAAEVQQFTMEDVDLLHTEVQLGPSLSRRRETEEYESSPSTEARPFSPEIIYAPEDQIVFSKSNRSHQHLIDMEVVEVSSPDAWREDYYLQEAETIELAMEANEGLRWEATVSQGEPAYSGKWREDDPFLQDTALHVNQRKKSVQSEGVGKGRGNATNGVDFWGKNAAMAQRGTLTKINATRRSSFGSVDNVENEWPQDRRGWNDVIRGDSPDGDAQAVTSGRKYEQNGRESWDNEAVVDDFTASKTNVRGSQNYQGGERDGGMRNGPLGDRNWSVDPRGSIPKEASYDRDRNQKARDVDGRYNAQERTSSSSNMPSNARDNEGVQEQEEEEEDYRYRSEDEDEDYGRNWNDAQNSAREMQQEQEEEDFEPQRSPDSAYYPSQMEPTERNLPVRQPRRAQDKRFDRLLDEGEALLEEGMQGLEGRIEVGVAEGMLYEASNLFEAAAAIDPSSLIAIGFWGNTLLVHGELKLKLSQQLRSMLPSSYSMTKPGGSDQDDQRESLEIALQEVCEECEQLLVDAGRKYRMALSLDRADMRALYNWGLALCYRGQLIADEGGERAIQDADKVYLAAIDKFEAMSGISQEYAAGALYNWGLAMRDRARLRTMGDRDRVKLLRQAKELFQDALRLEPNNGQARGGVAAAMAELQELQKFEDLQNGQGNNGRQKQNYRR